MEMAKIKFVLSLRLLLILTCSLPCSRIVHERKKTENLISCEYSCGRMENGVQPKQRGNPIEMWKNCLFIVEMYLKRAGDANVLLFH